MDQDGSGSTLSELRGGKQQRTAATVVNSISERQLADILFNVCSTPL
jgi:16S rRNA C1402 N4-methylase RsmH